MTLEDETGVANIIVWKNVMEKYRRTLMTARLIRVTGHLQREGIVAHIIAQKLEGLSHLLDTLGETDDGHHTTQPDTQPAKPTPRPRHPREQAKTLFPSRDFH